MQYRLAMKAAIIGVIVIGLQVALSMILGQIRERAWLQTSVEQDIANAAASAQVLTGPVVLVEWREKITETDRDKDGLALPPKTRYVHHKQLLAPRTTLWQGNAAVEARKRGIYHANLFRSQWTLQGTISLQPYLSGTPLGEVVDAQAYVVLGISDQRGITNSPALRISNREIAFQAGNKGAFDSAAIYADLGPIDLSQTHHLAFEMNLDVMGTSSIAIAPTAAQTDVAMQSNWPHPSFQGRFLPTTHAISDGGYNAQWQVSHLARNFDKALDAGMTDNQERLQVSFVEPANTYQQSERAIKYGLLFIVLTFSALFVLEASQRAAIHPIQYGLVGLALAIFFLLLVSLSEHLPFAIAYLIAATACVLLLTAYTSAVLHSTRKGFAAGAGITALYGIVYGILLSEDNALLMGSLLLFIALAAVMLGTRHMDWYGLIQSPAKRSAPPAPSQHEVQGG
ncbi:cell envelope integrity protein CreD [Lampropedia puyangensis]|uniref:Cell envelope integrity protein CreD n=1 Tax=Lampropedia puyangensis TaxID=1330072 RepID=A0A4S8FF26_9BURK|nr:cell envelope integrity protein CreD [Lampropedia puyangensis]THU05224.1 cell envelope integrity protein CreD [Lampropedia puyangensis]